MLKDRRVSNKPRHGRCRSGYAHLWKYPICGFRGTAKSTATIL